MKAARVLAVVAFVLGQSGRHRLRMETKCSPTPARPVIRPAASEPPGLAPPLVSPVIANAAAGKQKDYPAMVVISGLSGSIPLAGGGTIASAMPPQQGLGDDEIAAVVNYVFALNGAKTMVNSADIARVRSQSTGHDELKRIRSGLMP